MKKNEKRKRKKEIGKVGGKGLKAKTKGRLGGRSERRKEENTSVRKRKEKD